MTEIQFVDRYGDNRPNLETMCKGQCEGMGFVPINWGDGEEPWALLWKQAHKSAHGLRRIPGILRLLRHRRWAITLDAFLHVFERCDGWHFVQCPDCEGTGLRQSTTNKPEATP